MIKKLLFIIICLCVVSICYGDTWQNSLKPKGKIENFVASKNNLATCVIIIPKSPVATEVKAAKELQKWFKEICGIEFKVLNENNATKVKRVISVGNTQLSKKSNLGYLSKNIEAEGYAIIGKNGNLFLLGGNRRGPLYAAYALLEEDMGVRWYTKKGESRIPKSKNLVINYVSRKYNPPFDTRSATLVEAYDDDFCLRNRINPWTYAKIPSELGGSTYSWETSHTFFKLVPPEKYFEKHPEYFSEINGKRVPLQLCFSNKEVLNIITEQLRTIFKSNKDYMYACVSPMDGEPLCRCAKCEELDKKEGSKSASLINGLNQICANIKTEFPDKKILTLAYLEYYYPPKTIKPADNLVILMCSDSHDWKYPFCKFSETDEYVNALKKWRDMGANIISYNYITNYEHIAMANPNMLVISKNIRELRDLGIKGVSMQGNMWSMGTDSGYMRAWVWGKLLWNPDLDTKSLMKDFIYGYYGKSSDDIWKYQQLLLSLWEDNHKKPHNIRKEPRTTNAENPLMVWDVGGIRWNPTISLYSKDFVEKAMKYLDAAKEKADNKEILDRVNLMRWQMLYIVLSQGVGYFDSNGVFYRSNEVKENNRKNFPYYLKLLDELKATSVKEDIKKSAEMWLYYDDVSVRIDKWREVLTTEPVKYPLISTNLEWSFITDPDNIGEQKGYINNNFDYSNWNKIKINANWESQGYENYNGYAWYKTSENITSDMLKNPYIFLYFGAVDEEAWVYINGKLAFEHTAAKTGLDVNKLWFMPFIFDAKPFLSEGKNIITVKVSDTAFAGGIYEPVYFIPYDKVIKADNVKESL